MVRHEDASLPRTKGDTLAFKEMRSNESRVAGLLELSSADGLVGTSDSRDSDVLKRYNKDQPRDERGRFTHYGSAAASRYTKKRYTPSPHVAGEKHAMSKEMEAQADAVVEQQKSGDAEIHARDYQKAYDDGYKNADKLRRKILNREGRGEKRVNELRSLREAAYDESAKVYAEYKSAIKEHASKVENWESMGYFAQRDMEKKWEAESPAIRELAERRMAADDRAKSAEREIEGILLYQRERVLELIRVPPESRVGFKAKISSQDELDQLNRHAETYGYSYRVGDDSHGEEHKKKTNRAGRFIDLLLSKDAGNAAASETRSASLSFGTNIRPFCHGTTVCANGFFHDIPVFVHEMGHALERDAGFSSLARGFLHKRCGDEKPHAMRSDGDSGVEWGREDDFAKAFGEDAGYVGRYYGASEGSYTEIFSMGLELLYRNPVKFARSDPEYFNFIVGAMRGDIKSSKSGKMIES